jgi:hypothetical protein
VTVRVAALLTVVLATATSARAQSIVYSQTSLAGSTGVTPGMYDQLGLLGGPQSQRRDFYEIFTNTGPDVTVNKAVVYGMVDSPSTAVLTPVILGTVNGVPNISVPDTDPAHALSTATVLPTSGGPGPIEIFFPTPVLLQAGAQLAFGLRVPWSQTVDATVFGTDTLYNGLSSTAPPYFTGFYATNGFGELVLASGNHYLVIESAPPDIQQVMSFFDISVQTGTLVGNGPGNSANGRLKALRNMLAAAANLIASGDTGEAITQLRDAYLRTDGNLEPPDFVKGAAAAALATKIQEVIALLGG